MRFRRLFMFAVPAMLAITLVGPASSAEAVARHGNRSPAIIVVSGEMTRIAVPVISTALVHHRHSVTLRAPGVGIAARGASRNRHLTVSGLVASRQLRPGCASWVLTDTDGSRSRIPVCVIGQTRLFLRAVTGQHGRYHVFGTVLCYHFDRQHHGYAPCPRSLVVRVQELGARGRWRTAGFIHPDRQGNLRARIAHGPGRVTVRLFAPRTFATGAAFSRSQTARLT